MIVILGPTASGKTELAVLLAHMYGGEVISADSRQVYRRMDIGTGKDLQSYKVGNEEIQYHLIDVLEPGEKYDVFQFVKAFNSVHQDIIKRGKLPILCGGTGMYIDAVLNGYELPEVPKNEELRNELANYSLEELVKRLERNKALHNTTDSNDRSRAIRAIEIAEATELEPEQKRNGIRSTVFGISFSRDQIKERITLRLKERMNQGMVEEVQGLIVSGVSIDTLKYYGLEYKFIASYLNKEINEEEMFDQLNRSIHKFSKRQMTWFRRMEKQGTNIHWIDGSNNLENKLEQIQQILDQ